MLLDENPGTPDKYAIFGGLLVWPRTYHVCFGVIGGPMHLKLDGHHAYQMVFGGAVWDVVVSRHAKLGIDPYALKEDGSITHSECPCRMC